MRALAWGKGRPSQVTRKLATLPVLVLVVTVLATACGGGGEGETATPAATQQPSSAAVSPSPTARPTKTPTSTSAPSSNPQPSATFQGMTSQGTTIDLRISHDGIGIKGYELVVDLTCATNPLAGNVVDYTEQWFEGQTTEGYLLQERLTRMPNSGSFQYRGSLEAPQDKIAEISAGGFTKRKAHFESNCLNGPATPVRYRGEPVRV
jgi:hypothetical protein